MFEPFEHVDFDITDKRVNVTNQVKLMLDRTNTIFEWEGLPDTIPSYILEIMLQTLGKVAVAKVNGNLYALNGNYGKDKNAYYQSTGFIVANPWLNISETYTVNTLDGKDTAVIIRNDSTEVGMIPIIHKYSSLMADNEITMRMADINMRMFNTIVASDDDSAEAARLYQKQIELGKLEIIADNGLFDGVQTNAGASSGSGNYITQLIEYHQYLKAGIFNEIGLQSNQNMKRERLNTAEVNADEPTLQPLIDNMLLEREKACEKINAMFGTSISVKLAGAWEEQEETIEEQTDTETLEEEPSITEDEPETAEPEESTESSETDETYEGEVDSEELQKVEEILLEVEETLSEVVGEFDEEEDEEDEDKET